MYDAADFIRAVLAQYRRQFAVGVAFASIFRVAHVDDDGLFDLLRKFQLFVQDTALHVARRDVVKIIKSYLPHRDGARFKRKLSDFVQVRRRHGSSLVRVDARESVNLRPRSLRAREFRRLAARRDIRGCEDHALHLRAGGMLEDAVQAVGVIFFIQMTMAVYQKHRKNSLSPQNLYQP